MTILNVVTFLWTRPGYRSKFTIENVQTMARMVYRHYNGPHRFICFNDLGMIGVEKRPDGVDWRPLWSDLSDVEHPNGAQNPSCYRRLKLYGTWAQLMIGDRVLSIDLDMVITGDVTELWNRPDPFVFWQDQLNPHGRVNGAMQLISPGVRDDVWSEFNAAEARRVGLMRGFWGSDQGWLAHKFTPEQHGRFAAPECVSWRVHCKPHGGALPEGARVVNFHGPEDPGPLAASVPWIAEHYR